MTRRVLLVISLAAPLAFLAACSSAPVPTGAATEVESAHLKAISAFNACDQAAFLAAYAENFTFTTSNTRAAFSTREALGAYLAGACRQNPSPQVTVKSQSIRFVGQTALLSGQYNFRVVTQGATSDITQNFTATVHLESGTWRVLAHHVSLAP